MTDDPRDIVPLPAPDSAPDWEALARWQARESSPAESRRVEAWLSAHPDEAAVLDALDGVVRGVVADDLAAIDVEEALQRVKARRDEPDVRPLRPRADRAPVRRSAVWWAIGGLAAAGLVAVAVARTRAPRTDVTLVDHFATRTGQRDSVRLPDGSRVVLAPGSELAYGASGREVSLRGAAWFAVVHDAARPFTVHAGSAVVRDVGTEFTVRTDGVDDGRGVAVAVTQGAVTLRAESASDSGTLLRAGDRGQLRGDGSVEAMRGTVSDADVAWTRGKLVFEEASLERVRADVRRWYGIELRVADSTLATRRLTATFGDEPPARVVEVIALALGAQVTRAGDTAVLRAR